MTIDANTAVGNAVERLSAVAAAGTWEAAQVCATEAVAWASLAQTLALLGAEWVDEEDDRG